MDNCFTDFVKEQKDYNKQILDRLADIDDNVLYAVKMVEYHNKDIALLKAKSK
ncbi:hypothetical protein JCM39194_25510 [Desulfotomaculum varum]